MKLMKMSGSEPCYYPDKWNSGNLIQYSHNCYAYALNQLFPIARTGGKPQPGMIGFGKPADKITCPTMHKYVMSDQTPGIMIPVKPSDKLKPCKGGYYKMYMMVNGQGEDFHFARADNTGYWSHKPGSSLVTNTDASGKKISMPHKANWNYSRAGGINYDVGCGYYCVKAAARGGVRVSGIHSTPGSDYKISMPRTDVYKLETKTLAKILKKVMSDNRKNSKLRNYIFKHMKNLQGFTRADVKKMQSELMGMMSGGSDATYVKMLSKL